MILRLNTTTISRILIAMFILLELSACSSSDNVGIDYENQSFQLVLLQGEITCNHKILGNSWETAWPALQEGYPKYVVYRAYMRGIEIYDWTEQVITLTSKESKSFRNAIKETDNPTSLCPHAFLILVDNTPIYGGMITILQSATLIEYPVIYLINNPESISLLIRPFHSIYPIDPDNPAWKVIKDEKIKEIFIHADKIVY